MYIDIPVQYKEVYTDIQYQYSTSTEYKYGRAHGTSHSNCITQEDQPTNRIPFTSTYILYLFETSIYSYKLTAVAIYRYIGVRTGTCTVLVQVSLAGLAFMTIFARARGYEDCCCQHAATDIYVSRARKLGGGHVSHVISTVSYHAY